MMKLKMVRYRAMRGALVGIKGVRMETEKKKTALIPGKETRRETFSSKTR